MLRGLIAASVLCVGAGAVLVGCGAGSGQRPEFADVVGAAEAKTRRVDSVTVAVSYRAVDDPANTPHAVAYWQAPDRLRFGATDERYIFIANKMYWPNEGSVDRFYLSVPSTRQSEKGKFSNFPVDWIGGIASRASAITFNGTEYAATIPVGGKSVTATMRIADGYIVWIRVVTPDTDTTYELSEFNLSPSVDEPPADKVDEFPSAPSCSTPTTAPPTSSPGILQFLCVEDQTTR